MDKIRTTIKTYLDNYKKEKPLMSVPKLLDEETFKKIINKNIRPKTLTTWTYSNTDVKNIKNFCEVPKNLIPLDKLKEILNNDKLAKIWNGFQKSLFNLYNYKEHGAEGFEDENFEKYFENLPTKNEEVKNIYNEITTQNAVKEAEEIKNKQMEKILRNKEISDKLNEEEKEEIKKQAAKEQEEIKKQAAKEKEEIKKQGAEKTEKIASKIKNKKDDEKKELQEIINKQQEELDEIKFKPMLKNYIDEKVKNSSYSLDKEQLINIIKKDIENNKLPKKSNPEKIYDDIKSTATEYIIKNLSRIKKLSVLTGYNNDLFNKLPPEIATIVQEEMNNKIQEDIRKKNRKYILPKELPRWERAVQQHNVNPMLGRGAWSN